MNITPSTGPSKFLLRDAAVVETIDHGSYVEWKLDDGRSIYGEGADDRCKGCGERIGIYDALSNTRGQRRHYNAETGLIC